MFFNFTEMFNQIFKQVNGKTYATYPEPKTGDACTGCVAERDNSLCQQLAKAEGSCIHLCDDNDVIWQETVQETAAQEQPPKQEPNLNEVLLILQEECSEVIQAVSKVIRFGWGSKHPERTKTNREELEEELGDLLAMYDILLQTREIDPAKVSHARANKYNKLKQYSKVFNV